MKRWHKIETTDDKAVRTFLQMVTKLNIRVYAIRERPTLLPDWVSYSDALKHGAYIPLPHITIYVRTDNNSFYYLYARFRFEECNYKLFNAYPEPILIDKNVKNLYADTVLSTQMQNTCCGFNRPMPDNLIKYM